MSKWTLSLGTLLEGFVDPLCQSGPDAFDFRERSRVGAANRPHRSKVLDQGALERRANPFDLIQCAT